jgi:hypothetical protein
MIAYMIIAMAAGFLISWFFAGIVLGVVFLMIWLDKSIIGYAGFLHRFGIEITTIATVFLGLTHGPIFAFFFTLIVVVIAHGFRHIAFPSAPTEWPPFVPYPYNFIDAAGAVTASLIRLPIFHTLLVVLLVKVILYIIIDRIAFGKPPDFVGGVTNVVFNLAIFLPLSQFFISQTGATLVLY